jgi:dTDP-4-dehydrorhamnose reductase
MLVTELVKLLGKQGEFVMGLHRGNLGMTSLVENPALVFANVDVIINAAEYANVDKDELEPAEAYFTNATLPKMLGIAAQHVNARIIQISTDYVFRGDPSCPYLPEDTPDPSSVYVRSKREGEKATLGFGNSQVILRAWLYGCFGSCFPKTIVTKLRSSEKLTIVSNQIGSPTHAKDLAEFIVQAGISVAKQRILHGVSLGSASWYEFVVEIAKSLRVSSNSISEISSNSLLTVAERPC